MLTHNCWRLGGFQASIRASGGSDRGRADGYFRTEKKHSIVEQNKESENDAGNKNTGVVVNTSYGLNVLGNEVGSSEMGDLVCSLIVGLWDDGTIVGGGGHTQLFPDLDLPTLDFLPLFVGSCFPILLLLFVVGGLFVDIEDGSND